ncbi:hypothetical protein [Rickettsiella massiliensis]|uniref:hypothetical protein n=1 Tax=Rickettsiella massiliensis TaxID=676517 RepID=UPI00029AE214|nr:hypothetical protein [Rickettsiella massiliensis]
MTTLIKTRAKLDDPLSGDTSQTTINLEKNDVGSGPSSFGISHKIQKNQENQSIKNFTLCLQSYRDGMLLLITNLPDKVWKTNNISVNLKDEVNSIYEDYINKLKGKAFGQQKQLFYTFLSEYIDLLEQHTTLNNPADTLITAQRYAVRENGTGPVKTPVEAEDLFSPDSEKNITYILQNAESTLPRNTRKYTTMDKNLEDYEREVIKNHNKQSDSRQHILPSSLRHIPGLANSFLHCLTINKKAEQSIKLIEFFRHATQVPISLLKIKNSEIEKELFSITCENSFKLRTP